MQSLVDDFLNDLVSKDNVFGWYYTDESLEETQSLYDNSFNTFNRYERDYVNLEDSTPLSSGSYGKVYSYGSQAVKVVQFLPGEVTEYEPENALKELYVLSIQAFSTNASSIQLFTELALTD